MGCRFFFSCGNGTQNTLKHVLFLFFGVRLLIHQKKTAYSALENKFNDLYRLRLCGYVSSTQLGPLLPLLFPFFIMFLLLLFEKQYPRTLFMHYACCCGHVSYYYIFNIP